MTRRRQPTTFASTRPTRTRTRPTPPKRVQWVVVEPDRTKLPPMLPPDPDASPQGPGTLRAPRRARRPRQCTVSYTHYPGAHDHGGDQHVPHVRLSGLWLEQLGFAIGTKLRITASEGQLLMEVLPPVQVPAKARSVRDDAAAARPFAIDLGARCH